MRGDYFLTLPQRAKRGDFLNTALPREARRFLYTQVTSSTREAQRFFLRDNTVPINARSEAQRFILLNTAAAREARRDNFQYGLNTTRNTASFALPQRAKSGFLF